MSDDNPFTALQEMIHGDPEYAWAWHCNLAVPILDTVHDCSHEQANQAAALIMAQMFGYDITTHPQYPGEKSPQQAYFEARLVADREEGP